MTETVESLAKELQRETVGADFVMRCLRHPAALVRANALWALGRLATRNDTLLPELERCFEDPQNQVALWGGTKVAHLAVEALAKVGTPQAIAKARALVEKSGTDREAILWHLTSEGLRL